MVINQQQIEKIILVNNQLNEIFDTCYKMGEQGFDKKSFDELKKPLVASFVKIILGE